MGRGPNAVEHVLYERFGCTGLALGLSAALVVVACTFRELAFARNKPTPAAIAAGSATILARTTARMLCSARDWRSPA